MFPVTTRILVVDDFSTMRKVLRKELKALGYTNVDEADDGKTALPMIQEANKSGQPYGLIISDWNMPGMKGIDLLQFCRSDEMSSLIPFIMVTSEAEQKNIVKAAMLGVSDYISKPFNAGTLQVKFEKVWSKIHKEAA